MLFTGGPAAFQRSSAWQAYAPAWAAPRGASGFNLGDHEWAKHGSCAGGKLGGDPTLFAEEVLRAGTPEVLGRGAVFELGAATTGTVKLAKLRAVYGDTAVLTCEAGCEFGQIFICYGTAASGGATVPKACPGVALRGDTCKSCETITLPAYAAWEMDDWREIGTQ